jgi:hypothetical protein
MIAIFGWPNNLGERVGEVGKWGYDRKMLVFKDRAIRQKKLRNKIKTMNNTHSN